MLKERTPHDVEASEPDRTDSRRAATLTHGLRVLAAFRSAQTPLSNSERAGRTGLSRPRVSRLANTLVKLGYLRRTSKGRFELDLGVLTIAYPLLAGFKLRQLARPLMRDYATFAGGTTSLTMPLGHDYVYIETVRMTDAIPHLPEIGFTAPMATTAAGRALLSLYTDEELWRYVAGIAAERPEDNKIVETGTLPAVEACKRHGFALSLGEWRHDTFGVAAPVCRMPNGDCLAIDCSIPAFRSSAEQMETEFGPRMLGLVRSIRSLMHES
jgi:DNA-binding IclR family transcriptional regulator